MFRKRGFTLVETLFSLSIILIIIFSVTPLVSFIRRSQGKLLIIPTDIELGVKKMSQDLYTAYHLQSNGDTLTFTDSNGQNHIYLHNRRIIREPGFVIYMHDIDAIHFSIKGNTVYIQIKKGEMVKRYLLGSNILEYNRVK